MIYRNVLRHPTRSLLTMVGTAVALLAFTIIRTMIGAWYGGVAASAKDRLITRNAASLVFPIPLAYRSRVADIPGVEVTGIANWFGGLYKEERFVFPQFAIDEGYLDAYPDIPLSTELRREFLGDRRSVLLGSQVAERFDLKAGDRFQIRGTIYPGMWDFTVAGVFHASEAARNRLLLFRWEYLNERVKESPGNRPPDSVGVIITRLRQQANPDSVAQSIDALFANSPAETRTESETAFQQGFVSMSSNIILALNAISIVVLIIVLLVLANTMLMTARERFREYSILRSIGFLDRSVSWLIVGESLLLSVCGFVVFLGVLFPVFTSLRTLVMNDLAGFFPKFVLDPSLILASIFICLGLGCGAAVLPILAVRRLSLVAGIRHID
jgi:putative ABC transport system permease protein